MDRSSKNNSMRPESLLSLRTLLNALVIFFALTAMVFADDLDQHIKCGWGTLSPPYETQTGKKSITEAIQARRDREHSYLADVDGYAFLLHYDTEGPNAIPGDIDSETGLPVWIVETENTLQHVWHLLADSMGFEPPPMDQKGYPEDPVGGAYDIYFLDMATTYGARFYGYTWPETQVGNAETPYAYTGYLEIENDFAGFPSSGLDGLHVTIAHELFHLFHLGYVWKINNFNEPDIWWYEISSSWFEDVAYPDVNDYVNYVVQYFADPLPLDKGGSLVGYRASHYGYILSNYGDPNLLEQIWTRFINNNAYTSIDLSLREAEGSTLAASLRTFAAWNLFTGQNAIAGYGYPDAAIYPVITTDDNIVIPGGLPHSTTVEARDIRYFEAEREGGSQPYFHVFLQGASGANDISGVFGLSKNNFDYDFLESGHSLDITLTQPGSNGYFAAVNSGSDSGSVVLGLSEEFIRPYPNPVVLHENQHTIKLYTFLPTSTTLNVNMYNIRAQRVFQYDFGGVEFETGTQFLEMPLSPRLITNLSNGIYIIQLQGKNLSQTAKITVLR